MTAETAAPARRTKRRYAHELYPHGEEFEIRPLEVEVPYLYARMVGLEVNGTSWLATRGSEDSNRAVDRIGQYTDAKRVALLADALHQGMTGEEAWRWVEERHWAYDGELTYERAEHYGVPVDNIKPYPCGPEPDTHDHTEPANEHGWRRLTPIAGKESECPDCTEEVGS